MDGPEVQQGDQIAHRHVQTGDISSSQGCSNCMSTASWKSSCFQLTHIPQLFLEASNFSAFWLTPSFSLISYSNNHHYQYVNNKKLEK